MLTTLEASSHAHYNTYVVQTCNLHTFHRHEEVSVITVKRNGTPGEARAIGHFKVHHSKISGIY